MSVGEVVLVGIGWLVLVGLVIAIVAIVRWRDDDHDDVPRGPADAY